MKEKEEMLTELEQKVQTLVSGSERGRSAAAWLIPGANWRPKVLGGWCVVCVCCKERAGEVQRCRECSNSRSSRSSLLPWHPWQTEKDLGCAGSIMNSSWGREGKEVGVAVAHHGAACEANGLGDDVYVL